MAEDPGGEPGVVNIAFARCEVCGELSVVEMEVGQFPPVNAKWRYRKSFPPCDHFIVDSFEVRGRPQSREN